MGWVTSDLRFVDVIWWYPNNSSVLVELKILFGLQITEELTRHGRYLTTCWCAYLGIRYDHAMVYYDIRDLRPCSDLIQDKEGSISFCTTASRWFVKDVWSKVKLRLWRVYGTYRGTGVHVCPHTRAKVQATGQSRSSVQSHNTAMEGVITMGLTVLSRVRWCRLEDRKRDKTLEK